MSLNFETTEAIRNSGLWTGDFPPVTVQSALDSPP